MSQSIENILGAEAQSLLEHQCRGISKEQLHLPGGDYLDRVFAQSDRPASVLRSFAQILNSGRLAGTGYVSILPVDQGIEHSAIASFAPNPMYFDPKNIVELAIAGGCNAVASTYGALASVARSYAHKIPFVIKLNHNETLTLPAKYDQTLFAQVEQAFDLGAVAIGATIYFGAEESRRQIIEISEAFARAHELGMVCILWAYTRNAQYKHNGIDYNNAADLTGQANHIGVTIGADIIKQKQATLNGAFRDIGFSHTNAKAYGELASDHPIDLTRLQLANCYMGRIGLINSGGASGENDYLQAVRTAVINKRAGGMGLISGRKCFQKPFQEGVALLHAIQDVYRDEKVTIA